MLRAGSRLMRRGRGSRPRGPPARRTRRMSRGGASVEFHNHGCELDARALFGLMSGTSFDAIDAAVADIDRGTRCRLRPLGSLSAPYDDDLREELAAALPPAPTTLETVCRLDTRIGQAFAELAAEAIARRRRGPDRLARPDALPLGRGRARARDAAGRPAGLDRRAHRCPGRLDLRSRDVAAGGQGAPLVSLLDALLLAGRPGMPAALNLGGIANVTIWERTSRSTSAPATRSRRRTRQFTGAPFDVDGRSPLPARSSRSCWTACSPTRTTRARRRRDRQGALQRRVSRGALDHDPADVARDAHAPNRATVATPPAASPNSSCPAAASRTRR